MEDPEPPPDPLLPFLILPTATPESLRSAPSSTSHSHPSPDPVSSSADLSADGSHCVPRPSCSEVESTGARERSPAVDVSVLPAGTSELEGIHDGQHASEPPSLSSSGAQRPSLLTEQAAPPPQLSCDAQEHSIGTGFDAAEDSQHLPRSPTRIDPELQAQAWALIPNLEKDLNNLNTLKRWPVSVTGEGTAAITSHPEATCKSPADRSRNPQEDTALQSELTQSRIPASQKGKAPQRGEGIHGAQTTTSYAQATPPASTVIAPPIDSNEALKNHKLDQEGGWEPAKTNFWKKQDPERTVTQFSNRPRTKSMGTIFFRSKMDGRCFNYFSPNHQAHSCHRPSRCWKCYHSGHKAIDCSLSNRRLQYISGSHQEIHHTSNTHQLNSSHSSHNGHKTDHRSFAEVVCGKGGMAAARYPGDPRARPGRGFCAVSATGDIRRRRDELIGRAAVCWLPGNSHDSEPHHLVDALRNQLDIHHHDVQVLKHYPEQFLVIFNNPRDRQRVVEAGVLHDNGSCFQFAAWGKRRYANNINWEFRVKVRIEGVLVHCWAEEVAAKVLGKSCAVHYLEETTRRRQRTRSFDLWAWCCDPCDIPMEVLLTVTEPDRGHPHRDELVDLKRGQVYVLRNHLEIVEDLTFLQDPGRLRGPANRKAHRVFDWDYGVPDTKGEQLHGRRGHDRGRDIRPRRDDDDYDGRRNHANR